MATPENMNRPLAVSNGFLLDLAGKLTKEWLDLGRYLEISDALLGNIKEDNRQNVKEAKYQMLLSWKGAQGQEATYSSLAEALLKSGRKDLSEYVLHEKDGAGYGRVKDLSEGKKTQFVKELRKKYRNLCGSIRPVPFLRDKYDIDQLFVDSGIKFLEERQIGSKEQEKWTGFKNYKAVFTDPRMKSNRRIIDGEPGYGKSTLALQITHDWYCGTPPMNDFEILILLRLRQFRNVPTIYIAIKKFLLPKDSKLTEDDIEGILDSSSTVILLDGYDEYPGRGTKGTGVEDIIEDIVNEDMCQEYDVILTTRTSCLPPDYSRDTKRVRLTGFDDDARDKYIRNVVAGGNSEDADRITQFLRDNPVPADLCKIPLFFSMIAYMVHKEERFFNLRNFTDFFRHVIKCFYKNRQIKFTQGVKDQELDHGAVDKIAFKGLCEDAQQISWGKDELRKQLGDELYDEYVHIGFLIEEEGVYDFDAMDYKTETRFFHKLFVEWFAAHYLIKEATVPGAEFEPWQDVWVDPRGGAVSRSQGSKSLATEKAHELRSLTPHDVYYMYRYACGLNHDAALKIIEHLGKNRNFDKYTLLCITEWTGSLEEIVSTVTSICSRGIHMNDNDSVLLQKSAAELTKFASDRKIPIDWVRLTDSLNVDSMGSLCVKPSNLPLPVMNTLKWLEIVEYGRELTEEEADSILQYSALCLKLNVLLFDWCILPRYIKVTESMSVLNSRNVQVWWNAGKNYTLNLESGQWGNNYWFLRYHFITSTVMTHQ